MHLEELKNFLIRAEQKNKLATSYLLTGGNEALREELALFLSMLLVCEQQEKPCGSCALCRQARERIHPDVRWVTPEKHSLSIDEVRNVKQEIYVKPYSGARKAYILTIASMREEAANSLLKILEEPPLYGMLLIVSGNVHNFLSTIVSRCQPLKLNVSLPSLERAAAESQKQFAALLASCRKQDFEQFFGGVDSLVKTLEREEVEQWLEHSLWMLRDCLLANEKVGDELLVSRESCDTIPAGTVRLEHLERVLEMKQRLRLNVNIRIGLESLFFQLT